MKKSLRLGDVCKLLDLQPYVLRYWETEFPSLRAEEGSGPNRIYGESEVALLRRIKTLLYEEGYTIAGAKKKLESEPPGAAGASGRPASLFADEAEEPERSAADADEAEDEERAEEAEETVEAAGDVDEPVAPPRDRAARGADRLDTSNDERIETLRRGVARALEEAREILALLEPRK